VHAAPGRSLDVLELRLSSLTRCAAPSSNSRSLHHRPQSVDARQFSSPHARVECAGSVESALPAPIGTDKPCAAECATDCVPIIRMHRID
jgi:hypothetical protein